MSRLLPGRPFYDALVRHASSSGLTARAAADEWATWAGRDPRTVGQMFRRLKEHKVTLPLADEIAMFLDDPALVERAELMAT